ncbi:MAG: NmrA family NAD(P)-binding protein [Verrucomicrobia bacterium]|nr:NmrA family NAD(P)-binding protein [Verrucomicrobiota bacterium]
MTNPEQKQIFHRILAVGADGKFAGLVIPELARRGANVRGLLRRPDHADQVRQNGASEIAIGDLNDPVSLQAALRGVDAVFYVAPAFLMGEAELGVRFVEIAKQSGVRRFVFSSVIHPILNALSNHQAKQPLEEAILSSNMEFTFLHPAVFFQNLTNVWPRVVESGVLAEPWSSETRFSRVDYRDVAKVAALALTEDLLVYGTFELCSDGRLNRHDVAALMSDALDWEIKAEKLDPTTLGNEGPLAAMKPMFEWYDHHSLNGNPLILRSILGHEPRTLKDFISELAANGPVELRKG